MLILILSLEYWYVLPSCAFPSTPLPWGVRNSGTAAERMRLRLCSTSIADSEKGGLDGAVAGVTTKLGFVVGLPSRRDWLLATKTSLH